jgi:hypothetical protein
LCLRSSFQARVWHTRYRVPKPMICRGKAEIVGVAGVVSAGALCLALLAALLLALGWSGNAAAARAGIVVGPVDLTLRLDPRGVPEIAGKRVVVFGDALRAFGRPAVVAASGGLKPACDAFWPRFGLEIDFSTARPPSCAAQDLGRWQEVTASAKPWHTDAGLRIGDPLQRLRDLYPRARQLDVRGHGRAWELETGGPFCDGGPVLALAAEVRSGRVGALAIIRESACG